MRKLLKQPLALILLLPLVLDLMQPGKVQGNEFTAVTTDSEYVNINGTLYRRCINGYLDGSQNCVAFTTPICPGNQVLVNGLCYNPNQLPTLICPEGYYLYNKLCYPLQPKECPFGSTTTTEATTEEEPYETTPEYEEIEEITEEPETTTTTEEPTTTTTPQPIPPLDLTRCPPDAVVINDQCRKIICAKGEFYNGMCLLPACPEGTVWYREECQPPGYVTTIIQIENRLHNEQRIHKPHFETINVNRVEFKQPTFNGTATPTVTGRPPTSFTTSTARSVWTSRPTERQPEYHDPAPGNITLSGCCTINTPRLCKQYGPKWVCFHKRYKRCNPNICSSNKIYLKAPEINYESSVLVMPPNPPLRACEVAYCDEGDTVDCSGCAHSDRATCSPYCYSYMCPNGSCSYMDLREYCSIYPGEFGCSRTDGCTWHWCE